MSIDSAQDLEEYLLELLDGNDPLVHKFIHDLLEKWDPPDKLPENVQVQSQHDIFDVL